MVPQKIISPEFKVYDANGALDKKWFVYWYEGKVRKRKYGDINSANTVKERRKLAQKLRDRLKKERRRRTTQTELAIMAAVEQLSAQWTKKTKQDYKSKYNTLLEYLSGREASTELIVEFFIHLRKSRSATTVNKYRTVLQMLFKQIGVDYLFDDIPVLKAVKTPKRYFQSHQMRRLGQDIQENDAELWLFIQFMFYCFLRPKEIRLLTIGDIDFDDLSIYVAGGISKNDKSQAVMIPDVFVPAIEELMERDPKDFIFKGKRQEMLGRNTMYERFRAFLRVHGFNSDYSLYSVRHTGAVAAVKAGASLKELQLQFRHHSLDQTDQYLRQLGVRDIVTLRKLHPHILNMRTRSSH
ncbi:MAG: site-specific integrase [Bacteroidota bacterium]